MKFDNLKYWLLKLIWVLFSLIPLPVMYILSDILFYPFYYWGRYRRRVVRKNLTECFPEKDLSEIKRIEKRFYHYLLDVFFEICKYATISKKNLKKRMSFENADEVNRLLQQGKSISLYLGHYGNWEWISSIPLHLEGENIHAGQIYHKLSSKLSDRLMLENRSRMGAICIEMSNTLRWINEQLSKGITTITGYIADQSPRKRDSRHFLNFLNHRAPVMIGAEKITKRYNMEAYYLDVVRVKRGHYKATFTRMTDNPSSLPDIELTEIYYTYLEKTIRRHPEYYLWSHNRFRNAEIL
ncbi:lysophospholipid acyltransferase family protein [Bacteroides sp. OttesenSCG-928-D19]|nr:lysophospholipid acyltransferase family protein [Bacteroides sp. OttesenSCG-928-D19]